MFTANETEKYYIAFNQAYKGDLKVYVDGSFDCDYDSARRSIPMGAGWSMTDNDENLMGYGVAALAMPVTKSAEQFELNAMLTFFDAIKESFPERVNKRFKVTVICDNQALIRHLSAAVESEQSSLVCQKRYGDYYLRLAYYMSAMDLEFEWVKGHDSNDFNRLADFLAKKAYQSVKFGGSFEFEDRRNYSEYVSDLYLRGKFPFKKKAPTLTFRQLRSQVSSSGIKILTEIPTLWIGVEKEEHKGRTFAGFSFADTGMKEKGIDGEVFQGDPSDFYLAIRAINYALGKYSLPQESLGPVVVRTDNSLAASMVNTIRKGHKWRHLLDMDSVLDEEVNKLREFIEIQPVIALEMSDFAHAYKSHSGMMASKKHTATAARSAVDMLLKVAGSSSLAS